MSEILKKMIPTKFPALKEAGVAVAKLIKIATIFTPLV
jgi:hypothetical protein